MIAAVAWWHPQVTASPGCGRWPGHLAVLFHLCTSAWLTEKKQHVIAKVPLLFTGTDLSEPPTPGASRALLGYVCNPSPVLCLPASHTSNSERRQGSLPEVGPAATTLKISISSILEIDSQVPSSWLHHFSSGFGASEEEVYGGRLYVWDRCPKEHWGSCTQICPICEQVIISNGWAAKMLVAFI